MPQAGTQRKLDTEICTVRPDRVQIVARTWTKALPEIPRFVRCSDTFVRSQTSIRTYDRVRNLKNHETQSEIYLQYHVVPSWLEPVKLTCIGDDFRGLQRAELEAICSCFRWTRLLTVELAFDFDKHSAVDREYVLNHASFGKSRLIGGRFYTTLHFGGRHSDSLTRCYEKPELGCYRVEIQLHSRWLRRHGITQPQHLFRLPSLLCFDKIKFVDVNWSALSKYAQRKGHPPSVLADVRSRSRTLHQTLTLLRTELCLVNVHRFLTPLRINETVKAALEAWAERWRNSSIKTRRNPL